MKVCVSLTSVNSVGGVVSHNNRKYHTHRIPQNARSTIEITLNILAHFLFLSLFSILARVLHIHMCVRVYVCARWLLQNTFKSCIETINNLCRRLAATAIKMFIRTIK